MPRSKRYLIGELIRITEHAAVLAGAITDEPSNVPIWSVSTRAKSNSEPPEPETISALQQLCDHVLGIEEEANLPPRERMRPHPLKDYMELRLELSRLTLCTTSALWELTKSRCTWAAIDPDLITINRITAQLALLLIQWHDE
jgi:hypothetical protein